jgi:hypothetical protein
MYIILGIILCGIAAVCIFILGGLFTRHLMLDALDEARRERMMEDAYRFCGVKHPDDPKPYIPPTMRPKTPRNRYIPGMSALDRLLREGKRGTIMVRGGR